MLYVVNTAQVVKLKVQVLQLLNGNMMSLLRDIKFVSRDKNVDLTGVLSCRATLLECLRHNHLRPRQVPMMRRHKPDLLLSDHKKA